MAQRFDMGIHRAGVVLLGGIAPNVADQHGARHGGIRVAGQIQQQLKLLLCQVDPVPVHVGLARGGQQRQRAHAQLFHAGGQAAQRGLYARLQFAHAKGLGDVVLSAQLQPHHLVVLRAAGRDDDDWDPARFGPGLPFLHNGKAILFPKHQIQQQQVRRDLLFQRALKRHRVRHPHGGVSGLSHSHFNQQPDLGVILHDPYRRHVAFLPFALLARRKPGDERIHPGQNRPEIRLDIPNIGRVSVAHAAGGPARAVAFNGGAQRRIKLMGPFEQPLKRNRLPAQLPPPFLNGAERFFPAGIQQHAESPVHHQIANFVSGMVAFLCRVEPHIAKGVVQIPRDFRTGYSRFRTRS